MGYATSGSLFDTSGHRITEVINKSIETFLPTLDPFWRDNVVTAQGVGPASELGRDLKIIKTYRSGTSGVIEPSTGFDLYGGSVSSIGNKLYTQSVGGSWPSPLEGPRQKVFRLGVGMKSMLTNFHMTLGELQAEATPAFIGEIIAPALKGFAQNISHTLCNYWYISHNSNFRLGTISLKSSVTDAGDISYPDSFTFVVSEGTIDRFQIGQRVDIFNPTDNTRRNETDGNRMKVWVSKIDELSNKVTLTGEDGAFEVTQNVVADGDYIVYANQSGFGIAGINSWLNDGSNTAAIPPAGSMGALKQSYLLKNDADSANFIDVNDHPEFRSMGLTNVGDLTEHKLRQYLRRWHVAKGKYGQTIDCLVASDGVWLAYEAQKIGQYQLDRTGRLSSLKNEGSEEGFVFTFEGKTYKGYTSTYVEDGTVYGIKKSGGNWKRYVPPLPKGLSKGGAGVDSFVPFSFVVPALTGTSSTKFPMLTSSGALQDGVQMPGMMRMQLVPDQPAALKLTGVTTDTITA